MSITWYQQPWSVQIILTSFRSTLLSILGFVILSTIGVCLRFASRGIPGFEDQLLDPVVLTSVFGVIVLVAALRSIFKTYGQRQFAPFAIGLDDEYIYLDRSMYKPRSNIQKVRLDDVRRLNMIWSPTSFVEGDTMNNLAVLNPSWSGAYVPMIVAIDFQDRKNRVLYRSIAINAELNNVDELVEQLVELPAIALRVRNVELNREEFLGYYRDAVESGMSLNVRDRMSDPFAAKS